MMKASAIEYVKTYLKTWNASRIVQLVVGLVILTSGWKEGTVGISLVGGLFVLLAVLNMGCGALSGNSCEIDRNE